MQLLIRAAENALQTAQLFRTAMMGDKSPIDYVQSIHDLEHAGDSITHEIFKGLNKVFITPIDREDIMVLASKVDDVTDGIEATIARFDYLNVSHTDTYMKDFSAVIVDSCQHMLDAFKLLAKKNICKFLNIRLQLTPLRMTGIA